MDEMSINIIGSYASIVGLALAIVSIIVAIVQTIRISKIKDREYRETWKVIQDIRAVLEVTYKDDSEIKAHSLHPQVKSIFRHLIMIAVNLECTFNEKTIRSWLKNNKIGDTDWQKKLSNHF